MTKASLFDAAEYLDSPEIIEAYLQEAFESNDPALINMALADVERAKRLHNIDVS